MSRVQIHPPKDASVHLRQIETRSQAGKPFRQGARVLVGCLSLAVLAQGLLAAAPSFGTATVDGNISEWDLTADFFADMYHQSNPARSVRSKLYLRYDCATETMYVLALQSGSDRMLTKSEEAWIKVDGNKRVDDTSGNNGLPPDFAWYGLGYAGSGTARGWEASFAMAPGDYTLSVHNNMFFGGESQTVGNREVALQVACSSGEEAFDFGDAPASYPTLLPDGARHRIVSGFSLGATIDAEPDGQPSAGADGDGLDEDGVLFTSAVRRGKTATVMVTLINTAGFSNPRLDAWVDWYGDGNWEAGEQIFASEPLGSGENMLSFAVPTDAALGSTYARFRLSDGGGLSPGGLALNGEVEDYLVPVLEGDQPPPTAARLAHFTAVATTAGPVQVAWGTLVESSVLGFQVDRSTDNSGWKRITARLIPATGWNQQPQTYVLVDDNAPAVPDLTYRLVEVNLRGQEHVLAEATVLAALTADLRRTRTGLGLRLRGVPSVSVAVETAASVTGPWRRVQTLTLDGRGAGVANLDWEAGEPARFYRVIAP